MTRTEAIAVFKTDRKAALFLFVNEGIFNDEHKEVLRKQKIIAYSHASWSLTDASREEAEALGYL